MSSENVVLAGWSLRKHFIKTKLLASGKNVAVYMFSVWCMAGITSSKNKVQKERNLKRKMSCHKQSHYRTKSADYIAYYVQKRVSKFLLKYCTKTETKNNEILISLFK